MAVLPNKATIPRYHDIDPMQAYISARRPGQGVEDLLPALDGRLARVGRRGLPADGGAAEGHPRPLPGVLLDPRGRQVDPGPRGALPRLPPLPPRPARPRAGPALDPDQGPALHLREGESMLFDDSWEHEVFNHCPQDRVVLIVDIRRPMPFPFDATNRARRPSCGSFMGRRSSRNWREATRRRSVPQGPAIRLRSLIRT